MIKPMSESKSRKPPYLAKEITRHGRVMWYVRKGKIRVRLRADYGSAAFWEEYMAALAAARRTTDGHVGGAAHGTLAWLIGRYRESEDWLILSAATRRQRENIFAHVLAVAGTKPSTRSTRPTSSSGRIGAPKRRIRRAIFSTRCAACSSGRSRLVSSASIRPQA